MGYLAGMEILDSEKRHIRRIPRIVSVEMVVGVFALVAAAVMVWAIVAVSDKVPVLIVAGIVFTVCVVVVFFLLLNPDSVRARQTDSVLRLSSQILGLMTQGLPPSVAQAVCNLLLPNTAAIAVAITDTETILGYVGYLEAESPQGAAIRTQATHDALADGQTRVIYTAEEIGLPKSERKTNMIKAAIIVPLRVGREIRGTLKFYYRSSRKITETQKSIAQGFGELLSTQMAALEMENQRDLATSMELKMLQSQINPHFLFNTINTIASLIRTDPAKARVLLRDFAVFYRSTLENSQDRIPLARELEQTQRYFSFEVARFGEDRLEMVVDVDSAGAKVSSMLVPPFLLQPLVENAVKHAMPVEGKLLVDIRSRVEGSDVLIVVSDDGVGMDEEARQGIMNPQSSTGLGIAVKNVHDRMHGYYGEGAEMVVESALGEGTVVTLRFPEMASKISSDALEVGEQLPIQRERR